MKAGIVVMGTGLAQAILLVTVPVFSRLYPVEAFGQLGFFMLVGMIGVQLSSLRFDFAIAGASSEEKAKSLLALCMVSSAISMFFLSGLVFVLSRYPLLGGEFPITRYLPFLLLYACTGAIWNALTFFNIRLSEYTLNARFSVLRALLTVVFSLIFNRIQINGLILGLAIGQAFSTLALFIFTVRRIEGDFGLRNYFKPVNLLSTAKESAGFLSFSLPSAIIEMFSGQLPQLFIGSFGSLIFGWFTQANRLINAPLDLIGQGVRSVFWEAGAKLYRETGTCRPLFDKLLVRLFIFSLAPFILLGWVAPWLFSFILGAQWEKAGELARLLLPMCFFRFISNPLSSVLYFSNRQKVDFFIQAFIFSMVILIFVWPGAGAGIGNYKWAISIYSGLYCIKYLTELFLARHFAGKGATY